MIRKSHQLSAISYQPEEAIALPPHVGRSMPSRGFFQFQLSTFNFQLSPRRRGAAVIAFVVALMVIGTIVLWLLQLTASGARSYLSHYNGTGAFYAGESGVEMALREISQNNDYDSDGTIGTISNNGNDADNPSLNTGSFKVSLTGSTYTATGAWRGYTRVLEVETE